MTRRILKYRQSARLFPSCSQTTHFASCPQGKSSPVAPLTNIVFNSTKTVPILIVLTLSSTLSRRRFLQSRQVSHQVSSLQMHWLKSRSVIPPWKTSYYTFVRTIWEASCTCRPYSNMRCLLHRKSRWIRLGERREWCKVAWRKWGTGRWWSILSMMCPKDWMSKMGGHNRDWCDSGLRMEVSIFQNLVRDRCNWGRDELKAWVSRIQNSSRS